MSGSSGTHPMSIKVVLLKETPRKKALYQSLDINQDLCQRFSTQQHRPNQSINSNSIAYLSSIIQDENILTQNSFITTQIRPVSSHAAQWIDRDSGKMEHYRKLSSKKGNRYLSCLLGNEGRQYPSTQKFDRVISSKKVMPIDQLRYGKKNIKFSMKNKQDLNKDFYNFVQQKAQSLTLQLNSKQKQQQKQKQKRTVTTNRKSNIAHFSSMRHQKQKIKKMKALLNDGNDKKQLVRHPQQNEKQGFAILFKRLNNDLPMVRNFGWSKLTGASYNRN